MMLLGFLHLGLTRVPRRGLRGPLFAGGMLRPSPQVMVLCHKGYSSPSTNLTWKGCFEIARWAGAQPRAALSFVFYFFNSCSQISRAWLENEAESLGFKYKKILEHRKQMCLYLLSWGSAGAGSPAVPHFDTVPGSALTTGPQQQSFPSAKWEHKSFDSKAWKCSWPSWIPPLLPTDGTCMKFASFQGTWETNVSF